MSVVSAKAKKSIKNRFKDLDLNNPYWILSTARKGVKPNVFYNFAGAIKMPEKTLANILHLSSRTIGNYHGQQKALDPVYGEHLLKLIALYAKGETVFGNIDEFNYWLQKPFWNSTETPLNWMVTPGGTDLLIAELDKLAQGYPV